MASMIKCRDCVYRYTEDVDFSGQKPRLYHTCRRHPPVITAFDSLWPVINIEDGSCGEGKAAKRSKKSVDTDDSTE